MLLSSPSSCRRSDPARGDMWRRRQEARLLFAKWWSTIHVFYCHRAIHSWTWGWSHDRHMGGHVLGCSGQYGRTWNLEKHRGLPVEHRTGSSEGQSQVPECLKELAAGLMQYLVFSLSSKHARMQCLVRVSQTIQNINECTTSTRKRCKLHRDWK